MYGARSEGGTRHRTTPSTWVREGKDKGDTIKWLERDATTFIR